MNRLPEDLIMAYYNLEEGRTEVLLNLNSLNIRLDNVRERPLLFITHENEYETTAILGTDTIPLEQRFEILDDDATFTVEGLLEVDGKPAEKYSVSACQGEILTIHSIEVSPCEYLISVFIDEELVADRVSLSAIRYATISRHSINLRIKFLAYIVHGYVAGSLTRGNHSELIMLHEGYNNFEDIFEKYYSEEVDFRELVLGIFSESDT